MARDPKIEVAALNIRIPESSKRDYKSLIEKIANLKRGVRVHGETYCAIRSFNPTINIGVISKYTEIDIDGEWFDIDDFDTASPDKLDDISIPQNLKPNHAAFYFLIDEKIHTIVFETYSESKGLSAGSFEKYFKEICQTKDLADEFGRIEVDVIKDYSAVQSILQLPELKELSLIIKRPNPDDIPDDLAAVIEGRLREQNGDEYVETLKAKGKNNLVPNDRTKKLAGVAADNGQVHARSMVNGVMVSQDTVKTPLTEVTTYKASDGQSGLSIFTQLASKLLARVMRHREI